MNFTQVAFIRAKKPSWFGVPKLQLSMVVPLLTVQKLEEAPERSPACHCILRGWLGTMATRQVISNKFTTVLFLQLSPRNDPTVQPQTEMFNDPTVSMNHRSCVTT